MHTATAFLVAISLAQALPVQGQQAGRARDVGFVATPMVLVTGMLDLAGVADSDVVYDLGSGDGRIVIAAARRGARAVGVELDSVLVEESRASADTAGVAARTDFRRADLFATDLRPATVLTLYLGRELNQRLRPIFLRDLRPGTRVVSQAFDMGDWEPDSVVTVRSRQVAATPVHLWIIPAAVAGRWELTVDPGSSGPPEQLRLDLSQRYQTAAGMAMVAGSVVRLHGVRLRGDRLAFAVGDRNFEGRIAGDRARGMVEAPGTSPRSWRAIRTQRP